MPFVNDIIKYKSLSIVGTEKNVGKTETLNYILKRLTCFKKKIAVTSIGIDGEGLDQVIRTEKPEITIFENMLFVTSEKHYATKQLISEVLAVSNYRTSLGRLVTARAVNSGKVLLSGPADTVNLQKTITENMELGADITIVDGALSRISLASPTVTQAMILATGAAFSINISNIVKRTKLICELISLEIFDEETSDRMREIDKGVWGVNENGELHYLQAPSSLMIFSENSKFELSENTEIIFVAGVVTDKMLDFLRMQKNADKITVVVKDFTKIFVSHEAYNAFLRKGGKIKVLYKTKLIAITVNPVSPQGYTIDSDKIQEELRKKINLPVYDIRKLNGEAINKIKM